ncbi:MAG: hypothetical protein LBJ62_03610 [Bifidobacteriaceae bacterium]|nr:hypothetical protein [Bifidobacteriaceae bacterium]
MNYPGGSLRVVNWFYYPVTHASHDRETKVAWFRFADGTNWDLTEIRAHLAA